MRIFLLIIFLFNFVIALESNEIENNITDINLSDITITLPEETEENVTNLEMDNIEEEKLKIAVLINKKKFFKYLPSLIDSIDAYLLNKEIDFEVKVFNFDNNLTVLDNVTKNYDNIFIYSTNTKIVNELINYPQNRFFLPIININQVVNPPQNVFFGGLDFYKQIKKLSSFISGKTYIIKDNNILSNWNTNIEKNMLTPKKILTYPVNYKYFAKRFNRAYIFVNTKVVHTAQILSNFTYYEIEPKLILSTQINYNPLIFSLTTASDVKKLIVANSLLLPNIELLDVNMNLGSDLKFNWLNYTTSALLNKVYIDEIDEYPYFLNDFGLYIFHHQVNYKVKLYRIFNNGFIEVK